jgi:hexosaminidase
MALRRRFMQWQQAAPVLEAWAHRSIRLSDIEARAKQLGNLARAGLEALSYIDAHTAPPSGWQDSRMAVISDAEQPSALVRFVFLPDLRKLVDAAANSGPAQ